MSPDLDLVDKPTLLVVDDAPDTLLLISQLLRDDYKVRVANNGEKALRVARASPIPDLILLDVMMPEMDGHEVCRQLMGDAATRDIPVIFLTAKNAEEDEEFGFALGAVDYITKPVSPSILKARVRAHLAVKGYTDFLLCRNDFLEQEITRRTREITAIQDVTIMAMASMAETRDSETGNHIRRTQLYVRSLALKLRESPRFNGQITDQYLELLVKSAPLHDIGKVGIPDRILLKPGKLTAEEFEIMKTHTTLGKEAIERAEVQLGTEAPFLVLAKEIAYSHQEKWDGSGYPLGLWEDEIPLSARLMAVADVYDALISRRVYKEPMPHDEAARIIMEGRGKHFDPDIVDAFRTLQEEFQQIALHYADTDETLAEKRQQLADF